MDKESTLPRPIPQLNPDLPPKLAAFQRLLDVMDDLRANCPWDKKQTIESLRHLTIEETYELADAILQRDMQDIKEELGDIMLHMVFYAKIGEEQKSFDMADVCQAVCEKLIVRHPHIYSDTKAETEEQVKQNWEQIKLKEGKKSILQGVPDSLPAIVKAFRIQEKAKQVGFEWENIDDVWAKVKEEIDELEDAVQEGEAKRMEEEFGDVLFALVNYARYAGIEPEGALQRTNMKFKKRFEYIEKRASENNRDLADMTLEEMDVYWNEAKNSHE